MTSLLLLAMFAILAVAGTGAAVQSASNVVVTNTTTNSVPVKQGGTWNTYILGSPTVRIGNAPSAPIPSVDVADKNPVRLFLQSNMDAGSYFAQATLYTVPAGKRLIIDYWDVASYPTTEYEHAKDAELEIRSSSGLRAAAHLALTVVGRTVASAGNVVHLTAEAGETVTCTRTRDSVTTGEGGYITLCGHLVTVP
jgi:hypothetical protein